MASNGKVMFDTSAALIFGIFAWFMAVILETTDIFYMIPNLPTIGLFLGTFLGGLHERIPFIN
jgi:hypothetical protein